MKKIVLILLLCLTFLPIVKAETYPESVNLQIQILKYDPYPAEPGQYVHVWFNVENNGLNDAEKVTFEIIPEFPFSLDKNENATRYFGKIEALDNVGIDYILRVDANAVEGWNTIKIRYKTGESKAWIEKSFDIYVQTLHSIIYVENVETLPKEISPGEEGKLKLTIKNFAGYELRNIIVKLDLANLPLMPINEVNEKVIKILSSNESKELTFNLLVQPDASCGIYKIPILINYSDYSGNDYAKEYYVALIIGAEPKLELNIESSEILKVGDSGNVVISIANVGLTDVKFLKVLVNNSNEVKVLSPSNTFYIGSLDSDDYETFEVKLWVTSGKDFVNIPITLEYMDANNNRYEEDRSVLLKLYSSSEISRLYPGTSYLWLIGIILILILSYFVYRRIRK